MLAHVFACQVPNCEQHALSFVIARAVGMRFTKITKGDRTINCGHNFGQPDLAGWSCKHVAATHAAFALHEARALQGEQDLLQIWLGESCSFGDVAHTGWAGGLLMQGQGQQRPTCIVTTGRYAHATIVGPKGSRG